ncbi:MAG: hypothetical protein JW782_00845 [Candidatus Saganbacteria bacterium]|nr:hypothetical protein [Candidatus Saganbacteria bacterium]
MNKELNIFGARTTIESNEQDFLDSVAGNLYFFSKAGDKNPALLSNTSLKVSYLTDRQADHGQEIAACRKIGNNVYIGENKCIYLEGNLFVRIVKQGNDLEISARPVRKKGLKSKIGRLIRRRKTDYFQLVRKLVIFPVFYLLEANCGIFLLHGSAVNHAGKAIVMAGLAGIGKTTLAIALTLKDPGGIRFLSDNFLLFDQDNIYPFPEHIRLHDDLRSFIPNTDRLGQPIVRRFKRSHYALDGRLISGKVPPQVLFLPSLAREPYLREVPAHVAIDRLLLANDHVKEFHTYHYMGLLDYLNYGSGSLYARRLDTLKSLLSKIKSYEVGIAKGEKPYEWWERIQNVIS